MASCSSGSPVRQWCGLLPSVYVAVAGDADHEGLSAWGQGLGRLGLEAGWIPIAIVGGVGGCTATHSGQCGATPARSRHNR